MVVKRGYPDLIYHIIEANEITYTHNEEDLFPSKAALIAALEAQDV